MIPNPIDEIKAIRDKLSAEFDYDVHRIGEETRRQERESGRTFISLPRRIPVPQVVTSELTLASGVRVSAEDAKVLSQE